jgi:flagellar biosynthetic protein FliP
MALASLFGIFGALCLVLAVMALATRLARRAGTGAGETVPMAVLGRVALGPRQGLATVRVADRVVVVSMGDGGVRQVMELEAAPEGDVGVGAPASELEEPALARLAGVVPGPWRRIMRVMGAAAVAGVLALGALTLDAAPAAAQGAGQGTASSAVAGSTVGAQATGSQTTGSLTQALPSMQLQMGDEDGLQLSGTVGTVLVIGLLTLLPTMLLLMTSFTRVLIVLHFLRQAIGTQTAPPAQMIGALALLLTGFIMAPTLGEVNRTALRPWMDGQMDEAEMMSTGAKPFRDFMAVHVRESDLATFLEMSDGPAPETIDDVPLVTLVSAFAIGELRAAFQIGFVLFLPFLVIDLVVAAVLMSLGMFMLPPVMVSLPFKLLLFVLVDGWALIVHSVVASFGV